MNIFDQIPNDVREILARILIAVAAFIIIWLLRRALMWVTIKPLQSLELATGYDDLDDTYVGIVDQPARYVALAVGLLIAVQVLELDAAIITFTQHLARSLIILAVFVALFKLVDLIMPSSYRMFRVSGIKVDEQLLPFIRTALKVIIIAFAIVIVIQEWGYNVSGIVAGLGLGGLAFSLAAQDTVSNLFGFTTIVGDRPFVVGEFIVTPDVTGTVEKVGIRSTRIRQLDQALVTVPNNRMAASVVTNWSRLSKRWIHFTFGVTYATNAEQMRSLLQQIKDMLAARETVDETTVQVLFTEFGDSALNILVRCYVRIVDWYAFMQEQEEINLELMNIVEGLGLSMAFPSRSLYIEQWPEALSKNGVPRVDTPVAQRPAPEPQPTPGGAGDVPGAKDSDHEMPDDR